MRDEDAQTPPKDDGSRRASPGTVDASVHTVVFLDLSRFTALNDSHGDVAAVGVADRFFGAVHEAVVGQGRVVKTLGDGVLLDMHAPAGAIELADQVTRALHVGAGMPELAGGIATGPVIERDGDVMGATVNLASRLADLAPAGELRVTGPVARAAAEGGWHVEPLGPVALRGLHDPVDVFAVVLCPPERCVVDVMCGMRITPGPTTPTAERAGTTFSFCSPGCAARFLESPTTGP